MVLWERMMRRTFGPKRFEFARGWWRWHNEDNLNLPSPLIIKLQ
jgi:hypothetical protein